MAKFKVGDRVSSTNPWLRGKYPGVGTILEITPHMGYKIEWEKHPRAITTIDAFTWIERECKLADEASPVTAPMATKDACLCPSFELAAFGCQCGYVKRRRNAG